MNAKFYRRVLVLIILLWIAGCTLADNTSSGETGARVVRVIDGDTIDVEVNGQTHRVRYIGINTPESDEACFAEATAANAALVTGQQVRLVKDQSETDRFDRLLRYVYVGETFVNARMVEEGWAESARYDPDVQHFETFRQLEAQAASAGRGCHPTNVFNDGSYTR